jgi:tetratricopeptide (TPR) repeat protein
MPAMRREIESLLTVGALLLPASLIAQPGTGFPTVACPAGVVVTPSPVAVRAQRSLLQARVDDALESVRSAVQAQPGNPQHQYLLGRTLVALADYFAADSAFDRTVALCGGFGTEVEGARRLAWAEAFRQGMEAYQHGDTVLAVARWTAANELYPRRPDAWYNLGVVYTRRGDLNRAADAYRQVLTVVAALPGDTSVAEARERAETRMNAISGLIGVGARMFAANQFNESADLFRLVTTQDPSSRDGWYNYALALFKRSSWNDLVPVAERLTNLDPLNENARIILFNAHKSMAETAPPGTPAVDEHRRVAMAVLDASDALPIYVDDIRLGQNGSPRVLTGRATGNQATAGQPITLTFRFWGPQGEMGTASVSVASPAKGETSTFQVPMPDGLISSFSYTWR